MDDQSAHHPGHAGRIPRASGYNLPPLSTLTGTTSPDELLPHAPGSAAAERDLCTKLSQKLDILGSRLTPTARARLSEILRTIDDSGVYAFGNFLFDWYWPTPTLSQDRNFQHLKALFNQTHGPNARTDFGLQFLEFEVSLLPQAWEMHLEMIDQIVRLEHSMTPQTLNVVPVGRNIIEQCRAFREYLEYKADRGLEFLDVMLGDDLPARQQYTARFRDDPRENRYFPTEEMQTADDDTHDAILEQIGRLVYIANWPPVSRRNRVPTSQEASNANDHSAHHLKPEQAAKLIQDGDCCLICHMDFVKNEDCVDELPCGHFFHHSCWNEWGKVCEPQQFEVCPYCRRRICWAAKRRRQLGIASPDEAAQRVSVEHREFEHEHDTEEEESEDEDEDEYEDEDYDGEEDEDEDEDEGEEQDEDEEQDQQNGDVESEHAPTASVVQH